MLEAANYEYREVKKSAFVELVDIIPLFTQTKVCTTCGVEKTLDQFVKDKSKKNGISSQCKVCKRKKSKLDREERLRRGLCDSCGARPISRGKYKCEECYQKSLQRNRNKKIAAIEYKGGKCARPSCGRTLISKWDTIPENFQFHHLEGRKKEKCLSNMLKSHSLEYCKPELDKCILLCHDCHDIYHYAPHLIDKTNN